jgi:hypothetical protein
MLSPETKRLAPAEARKDVDQVAAGVTADRRDVKIRKTVWRCCDKSRERGVIMVEECVCNGHRLTFLINLVDERVIFDKGSSKGCQRGIG